MIDLHSHILPGLDDGAPDMDAALAMARVAVSDGISVLACTPHIVPGLYDNNAGGIKRGVTALRGRLREADINLSLVEGADVHIAPDLPMSLAAGDVPPLHRSRYFLLEPPHHVVPPRLEELVERLIKAGFHPILTHPERLTWIGSHYDLFKRINAVGCLVQITAMSVTGGFGKTARYYAEKMLDEGRVDIVASDAHNASTRPPILSRARTVIESHLGKDIVDQMFLYRPAMILRNEMVTASGSLAEADRKEVPPSRKPTLLGRLFGGRE